MTAFNEHGILPSCFCSLPLEDKAAIWAFLEYKAEEIRKQEAKLESR